MSKSTLASNEYCHGVQHQCKFKINEQRVLAGVVLMLDRVKNDYSARLNSNELIEAWSPY